MRRGRSETLRCDGQAARGLSEVAGSQEPDTHSVQLGIGRKYAYLFKPGAHGSPVTPETAVVRHLVS